MIAYCYYLSSGLKIGNHGFCKGRKRVGDGDRRPPLRSGSAIRAQKHDIESCFKTSAPFDPHPKSIKCLFEQEAQKGIWGQRSYPLRNTFNPTVSQLGNKWGGRRYPRRNSLSRVSSNTHSFFIANTNTGGNSLFSGNAPKTLSRWKRLIKESGKNIRPISSGLKISPF